MQNPLSERCFKVINQSVLTSDYIKILKVLLVEKEYLDNDVQLLLNRLFERPIPPEADILLILKEFLSILLLIRFDKKIDLVQDESIHNFFSKIEIHPNAFENSLVISYLALISILIGQKNFEFKLKFLPSGFVTVGTKEISIYGEQVVLQNQVEIALNLLLIALLQQSQDYFYQSLKIIEAFTQCLDENGELLVGVWSVSNFEERESLRLLTFLTTYTINQIANHKVLSKLLQLQSQIIENMSDDSVMNIGFYPMILSFAIDQILNTDLYDLIHELKFVELHEKSFSDVGFIFDKLGNFSTYLTLSGINQSIGSILTGDVQILAMGPHFFPLGDLSKFGIFQTINTEYPTPFSVERDEGKTLIKGMTKIIQADSNKNLIQPSDTWIELEFLNTNNLLKLTISLTGEPCKLPLTFAFFIKSKDTEMIGNKQVKPKSLDKYIGPSTQVVFQGTSKKFSIFPCFEEKMHLIPLQGKNHFWGADYLLACEISHFQKKYIWEFQ